MCVCVIVSCCIDVRRRSFREPSIHLLDGKQAKNAEQIFRMCKKSVIVTRSLLFWDTAYDSMVVSYKRFGTAHRARPLKTSCSETSVTNYQSTLPIGHILNGQA
jgi:hypothetical protein